MKAAQAFLDKHPLRTEAGYKHYVEETGRVLAARGKAAGRELTSLQVQKQALDRRIADTKDFIGKEQDAVLLGEYKHDLKDQLLKIKTFKDKIDKLKGAQVDVPGAVLTMAEFIELFENSVKSMEKIESMADLDCALRRLFTNFTIKDKKVANITQNSPFRELSESANSVLVTSRGIEPLLPG